MTVFQSGVPSMAESTGESTASPRWTPSWTLRGLGCFHTRSLIPGAWILQETLGKYFGNVMVPFDDRFLVSVSRIDESTMDAPWTLVDSVDSAWTHGQKIGRLGRKIGRPAEKLADSAEKLADRPKNTALSITDSEGRGGRGGPKTRIFPCYYY